jgi:hypothetical protein
MKPSWSIVSLTDRPVWLDFEVAAENVELPANKAEFI